MQKEDKKMTFRDFMKVAGIFKKYFLKYWYAVFPMLFFSAFGALIYDAVIPIYYSRIIEMLSSLDQSQNSFNEVIRVFAVLVLITLTAFTSKRTMSYISSWVQSRMAKDLNDYSFSKLVQHSQKFFADNFSGSIIAKQKRFVNSSLNIFDNLIYNTWPTLFGLMSILVVVYREDVFLGNLFLIWILVFISLVVFLIRQRVDLQAKAASADSVVTGHLSDVITNILNVKVFSAEKEESSNFFDSTKILNDAELKSWWLYSHHFTLQWGLMLLLELGSMYYTIKLWSEGVVGVGFVVLIQGFVIAIVANLRFFGHFLGRMTKAVVDMAEMLEIIEQTPDIRDPKKPEAPRMNEGNLEFKNISFEYKDGQQVFKDFNLSIPAGQKVGLVGHSGAGKSTITNLILRFADVNSGSIKIDGQDIRNVTQDNLRNHISYVPQEPLLFHRSIKENICYAKPDATMDEIITASKKAKSHEFIENLPNGYDTLVGERGIKLSGGQRQRVAVARVMLENAPIIVLDEATSALDSESEQCIQHSFEEVMKGKTSIVIAHRLSTIQSMDRIIVMEEGEIIEDGSHDELLAKKGKYHDLWNHQVNGFITES